MVDVSVLNVLLYGERIGTLTLAPGEQILFAFDQSYIDDPDRPVLSLSYKDSMGELITDHRPTRTRLSPFFSNLLPEGAMRDYLAKKAGINPAREFFLLHALGQDLPGALTISAEGEELWAPDQDFDDKAGHERSERILRFSLAGVQLKFSAIMEATGGLTIPVEGVGGSWIVKLPSMKFEGVPENEYAMMKLAREIGIDVPDVELIPLQKISGLPEELSRMKGNVLAVKRFDRTTDNEPIHIEDFAQVFRVYPEKKYERASYRNIAEVLWAETGEEGVAEFIRRLVFNVLIGNADMHLKNWSLIYPDRRNAALSPGYDFVSTIAYLADTNMALTLGRSKKMTELSLDQLSYFSAKARLPEKLVTEEAKETVERFLDVWGRGYEGQTLSEKSLGEINNLLTSIPIVKEVSK
ncbi:MAG: HipA domain-containing protein [Candidatus Thiodiazotropha endolucinida]